jgi:hypothetical protein
MPPTLVAAGVRERHSAGVMLLHPERRDGASVVGSRYEIRVRGRIGQSLVERFAGFDAEVEPAQTILRGPVEDQAALHGVLEQIQCLGLELVEVKRVGDRSGQAAEE